MPSSSWLTASWSRRDVDRLLAFCRESSLGVIPLVQTAGHLGYLLKHPSRNSAGAIQIIKGLPFHLFGYSICLGIPFNWVKDWRKDRIRSMMMSHAVLLFTFEDCKTIQSIQYQHGATSSSSGFGLFSNLWFRYSIHSGVFMK